MTGEVAQEPLCPIPPIDGALCASRLSVAWAAGGVPPTGAADSACDHAGFPLGFLANAVLLPTLNGPLRQI